MNLDELDDPDDVIDFDEVTELARQGLKNPELIAHAMELPVKWFTDTYKEKVTLAIRRGLTHLAMESVSLIRKSAMQGDFQAQKYLLQNVDDSWSDRKEVKNTNEIDIKGLPSLKDLFDKGLEDIGKVKVIDKSSVIDAEFTEE